MCSILSKLRMVGSLDKVCNESKSTSSVYLVHLIMWGINGKVVVFVVVAVAVVETKGNKTLLK